MGQQAHFDPTVPEPDIDVEVAPTIPNAHSALNEVVGDACQTHDVVADPFHEISLTQNQPSILSTSLLGAYPLSYIHLSHSFLIFLLLLQETFLTMWMCPLLLSKCIVEIDFVPPIVLKL
jgi:hypothetical protein